MPREVARMALQSELKCAGSRKEVCSHLNCVDSKMHEELEDEVTSINSIYGENTLCTVSENPVILALALPQQRSISIQIEFPQDYPNVPPSVLGTYSVGEDVAKGGGTQVVDLLRTVLAEIYTPTAPCIFDLVEESGSRLQQLGVNKATESQEPQSTQTDGQQSAHLQQQLDPDRRQPVEPLGEEPPWAISEVVSEKKSVFVARAASVSSVDQAKDYLAHLLATDKKVAKATHNITAWRIQGEGGVQFQDCDDDGESAAGGRVLHLLELMGVWDVMVVVTRWYGGVQLGPDRFRIINQTARDAVIKSGHAQDTAAAGSKKKGKK